MIRDDLLQQVSAFKFLISENEAGYSEVPEVGQAIYHTPVYVQPMDEMDAKKNVRNMRLATQLALEHGYRLSLQMHKIVGIR